MTYISTFFSHYAALVFSKKLAREQIPAKMMPVPRKLSSSCGTGVRFETDRDVSLLADEGVDKIFRLHGDAYDLIFQKSEPDAERLPRQE